MELECVEGVHLIIDKTKATEKVIGMLLDNVWILRKEFAIQIKAKFFKEEKSLSFELV